MKFNRNKGIATMAAILMLVIFNLYVFSFMNCAMFNDCIKKKNWA